MMWDGGTDEKWWWAADRGLDAKGWLSCALRNLQLRISFKPDLSGEGEVCLSKEKYRAYFI